ncbi:MAG TPA: DUF481 domain-containing protein [Tepidisphaeraceae bacterium]|nr:DUF481 domain-containing protein [Tepidisphaeraceae bacterium]
MTARTLALTACMLAVCASAFADQIVFKNGDKLTGKITTMEGGKMKVATAVAGDVTVDIKDIATFSTDAPIAIYTNSGKEMNVQAATAEADQIKAGDEIIAVASIAKINPPAQKWTGTLVVNGELVRGNTNSETLGIAAEAVLRRKTDTLNDRTTLDAGYNFGRQRDKATGAQNTTTDNWLAGAKYDKFFNEKLYGYGLIKAEHDRIADLNLRLSPGVGLGYQWIETPALSFNTEAGLSYVIEDYIHGDDDNHIGFRLAYHLKKQLNESVGLFHNVEWVPAFEDPGDYNFVADVGIHADLTKSMFSEFKIELKRDSTPSEGSLKNDLRYVLGIGWKF